MDDTSWSIIVVSIAFIIGVINSYILLETPDRYYVILFVLVLSIICVLIITKWHPEERASSQT